jgi:hypothetical protein
LQEKRRVESANIEQAEREFAAKRKNDCLSLYDSESKKWNNVRGWRYDENNNECYIRYKDPKPKSEAECDNLYPPGELAFLRDRLYCREGEFENAF